VAGGGVKNIDPMGPPSYTIIRRIALISTNNVPILTICTICCSRTELGRHRVVMCVENCLPQAMNTYVHSSCLILAVYLSFIFLCLLHHPSILLSWLISFVFRSLFLRSFFLLLWILIVHSSNSFHLIMLR
jgi:hypothetical protein